MKVTKALKRLKMLPCALAIALSLLAPVTAFAEETAAITTPGTVAVGEYFTVQVSFSSSENIGSVKAALDYDSDIIEFDSGNFAVGGGGVCNINAWAEFPSSQQNYELTFRAVSKGSSQIVITRCSVYSETGDLLGAPTYIGSVTVGDATAATTTQTPAPEVTTTTQTTTTKVTTATETTAPPETSAEQQQSSEAQIQDESIVEETPVTDAAPQTESSYPEKEKTDKKDDKGAVTAILITVGAVVIVGIAMTTGGSKGGKRRRKR